MVTIQLENTFLLVLYIILIIVIIDIVVQQRVNNNLIMLQMENHRRGRSSACTHCRCRHKHKQQQQREEFTSDFIEQSFHSTPSNALPYVSSPTQPSIPSFEQIMNATASSPSSSVAGEQQYTVQPVTTKSKLLQPQQPSFFNQRLTDGINFEKGDYDSGGVSLQLPLPKLSNSRSNNFDALKPYIVTNIDATSQVFEFDQRMAPIPFHTY